PGQKAENEYCAEDRDSGKGVRAVMKNLGHGSTRVPVATVKVVYLASGRQRLLNNSPVQHPLFSIPGFECIVSMRKPGFGFIVNECTPRPEFFPLSRSARTPQVTVPTDTPPSPAGFRRVPWLPQIAPRARCAGPRARRRRIRRPC